MTQRFLRERAVRPEEADPSHRRERSGGVRAPYGHCVRHWTLAEATDALPDVRAEGATDP